MVERMELRSVEIHDGDQSAVISTLGGAIHRYDVAGSRILTAPDGDEAARICAGIVLAPWPNRIDSGLWTWLGVDYQLEVNEVATHNALHGLVMGKVWEISSQTDSSVDLITTIGEDAGYPFPLEVTASYAVGADGLTSSISATNVGVLPVPVGLGSHPYIAAPDGVDCVELELPSRTVMLFDARQLPAGTRPATGAADFCDRRALGTSVLDDCFGDLDQDDKGRSWAWISRSSERIGVWGGPTSRWLMVYSGDTLGPALYRTLLAVEPMTCAPNAFRDGGIDIVEPGQTLKLDWGMQIKAVT